MTEQHDLASAAPDMRRLTEDEIEAVEGGFIQILAGAAIGSLVGYYAYKWIDERN